MGEDAPSASSLKPAVYAATFFSLVCVALNGAILGKGLNGDFATANTALRGGDSSSSIVTDDSSLSLSPATAGSQPIITDGNCLIDVRLQEEGETLDGTPGWFPENNVIVKLAGSECDVGVSPTWTVGDWDNTIVQIAPGATFVPPPLVANERHAIKLIRGTLIDVNYNGLFTNGHWETYVVSAPNRAAPLMIDSSKTEIKAGDDGAVIIYLKVTEEALKISVTSMDSGPVTKLAGPFFDKNRQWVKCSDYFGEDFASTEFYNYAGILIQENDESRLMYMQWWTLREDANADAYHKEHPNFGEMHMAYYTANGVSGMQTTLPYTENLKYKPNPVDAEGVHWWENDQTEVQIAIPWAPGVGHGPLWYVDPATGEPAKDCDGNMIYPFHRNLISANGEEQSPLRYTMWCAYEHPPEHVKVPLKMLTEWPNAYLQSEIDVACNGESERNQPIITEGECKVEVRLQEDGETLDGVPGWFTENNIVVKLPENCNDVAVSPTWTVGDWDNTIVQIAPDTVFNPPPLAPNERHAIKLVRGTLIDVNYNGIFTNGHWETFVVTAPNRAAPLMIDSSKTAILAGAEGAVIVYLKVTEDALKVSVTSMDSVPVTKLVGPYFDENRQWVKCSDYFGEVFEGTEFYNYAGILIQDEGSNRLMYMQWWTLREDADADAYHKEHPNFGEMHMAYYTANGVSGMQTTLPNTQNLNYQANPENATGVQWIENNQTEVQIAIPWAPGVGHGPLWSVDPMTGEPSRNCDGNMMYPFHRNLINDSAQDNEPLRFTMWCAYEHPPEHVKVPLSMLTEWPNAYLQTTMDPGQCGEATEGNTADGQGEVTGDGSAVEDSANTSDGSTNNSEGSGATGEASANESSNTFDRK